MPATRAAGGRRPPAHALRPPPPPSLALIPGRTAMNTHHTPRRSRLSRILVATLTVTLTIVTFVGLALAGAVVTDRQLHQPVPTGPAPATSAVYAEPGGTSHRLVVAFVVGHSRHHRQRPARSVRHLRQLTRVHHLRRRRRRRPGTPGGRPGRRPDVHVHRRRRRPRADARPGRRARPHRADRQRPKRRSAAG